jgi:hypothetical protein
MGFVDPGGEHVHILRNEGTVEARTIAVQLIPAGRFHVRTRTYAWIHKRE